MGNKDIIGSRYIDLGRGSRFEHAMVEVRVAPEVKKYLFVGEDSVVSGYYVFERGLGSVRVGNKTSIGSGSKFICAQSEGIVVGNNVLISWDCTFIDSDSHSLDPEIRWNDGYDWKSGIDAGTVGGFKDWSQVVSKPIVVEDGAWVGFGSVIMKGVRIGRGAVIAARSVVTRDVAPYAIFGGNPARFIRHVPRQSWTWEEIITSAQANPEYEKTLADSYLSRDLGASLIRFRQSAEYLETLNLIRTRVPGARTMVDVGGGNGVMAIAFALDGFDVHLVEASGDPIVGTQATRILLDYVERYIDASIKDRVRIVTRYMEDFETNQTFDVVYCRQALHHFRDPEISLKKMKALMHLSSLALLVREHVIYDEDDKQRFLNGHPFHRYYFGENAYTVDQYKSFVEASGLRLNEVLPFCASPINYYPHTDEDIQTLDERDVGGRPYSFVLTKFEGTQ